MGKQIYGLPTLKGRFRWVALAQNESCATLRSLVIYSIVKAYLKPPSVLLLS